MRNFRLLAGLLLSVTSTTFASHFYIFGEAGPVYQENMPDIPGTSRAAIDKYGYHLGGGYDFMKNGYYDVGLRLGFGYYGKTIWTDATENQPYSHTIDAYDFQGVATFHPMEKLDLLAHAGLALVQDTVINNSNEIDKLHDRPILGFGAAWTFQPHLAATFDYNHIFGNTVSQNKFTNQPSINAYWVGLRYKFGN